MNFIKKFIYLLIFLIISYGFIGFFVVGFLIEKILIDEVKKNQNVNLTLKSIDFNPFAFNLKIRNFELFYKGSTVVSFDILETVVDVREILDQKIVVKNFLIDTLFLNLELDQNRDLNILKLIPKTQTSDETKTNKEFYYLVEKFVIKNSKIDFLDNSKNGYKVSLEDILYKLKNLSNIKNTVALQELKFNINNKTTIDLKSEFKLNPMELSADVELKDLHIADFFALIKDELNFVVEDAKIDTNLNISFKDDISNSLNIKSNLSLKDLNITKNSDELLSLKELIFQDLNYSNNMLSLREINILKPSLNFVLNDDNTTNFSNLVKNTQTQNESNDSKKQEFNLEKITIKDGSFFVVDNSKTSPFIANIEKIDTTASNITSLKNEKTDFNGELIFKEFGFLKYDGILDLNDFKQNFVLNLLANNIKVNHFKPYYEDVLGYEVDTGEIALDLKYQINNKILEAKNKIIVNNLNLGAEDKRENSLTLPLKLAISLLKDPSGKIVLDLPINGNIDDPNFKITPIIYKTVQNLIVKVVASPFLILASLVGENDDNFKKVKFETNGVKILPPAKEKLIKLSNAIKQRPTLKLKIVGLADREFDKQAMQKEIFTKEFSKKFENIKDDVNRTKMENEFIKNIDISDKDLLQLASNRAENLRLFFEIDQNLTKNIIIETSQIKDKIFKDGFIELELEIN